MNDDAELRRLAAEAQYHRDRYDLYRAKVYSMRPTSQRRLRELQHACEAAEERLAVARAGHHAAAAGGEAGPLVLARLLDGPLAKTTTAVQAVEGRPPKTVDLDAPGGRRCRYCLDEWEQSGQTADYSFLYDV